LRCRVGIVYSVHDPAGVGVARNLRSLSSASRDVSLRGVKEAYYIEDLDAVLAGFDAGVTELDFIDGVLSVDYYVVVSKHSSAQGIKSFTTHHPGNPWDYLNSTATWLTIPKSNPPLAKAFLINLRKFRDEYGLDDFTVTYEVTHHGPLNISKAMTFIEIGSSLSEWVFQKAHEVVAQTVIKSINEDLKCVPTVGFGGNHYASRFTSRALSSDECYGHIIANYVLKTLRDFEDFLARLVRDAVLNSLTRTERVVAERKVGSSVRNILRKVTAELGVQLTEV